MTQLMKRKDSIYQYQLTLESNQRKNYTRRKKKLSYRNELLELRRRKAIEQDFTTHILEKYSPFMTDEAIKENQRKSQMMQSIYDQKIAQIEPLAQQEQQQQLVDAVLDAVRNQDNYLSETLDKSLESVLKMLKF